MSFDNEPGWDGDDARLDPQIAERFQMLDRLAPPDTWAQATGRSNVVDFPTADPIVRPRSASVWVAAAAGLVAVAGLSYLALTGGGATSELQTDDAQDPAQTAEEAPGPNQVVTITADVDEGRADSSAAEGAGESAADDGSADGSAEDADGSGADDAGQTDGGAENGTTSTTTPTTPTTGSGPATTVDGADTTTTSTDISLIPDPGDKPVAFTGTITAVFTDCLSHRYLAEDGSIQDGTITCDGGSWIEVNGLRIRTSSGFTADDQAWNRHPSSAVPGQQATVRALSGRTGYSLECMTCSVEISG